MKLFTILTLALFFSLSAGAQNSHESFERSFNHAEETYSKIYQDGEDESLIHSKEAIPQRFPFSWSYTSYNRKT